MNNTIWQIVGVLIGLAVIALTLSYVSDTIFSPEAGCQNACSFKGYRCDGDISESCLDTDSNQCTEYYADICELGCDNYTGICVLP